MPRMKDLSNWKHFKQKPNYKNCIYFVKAQHLSSIYFIVFSFKENLTTMTKPNPLLQLSESFPEPYYALANQDPTVKII